MTPHSSATLLELARHYLGYTLTEDTPEELCRLLGRYHHCHFVIRGSNLVVVAHPTPGQSAVVLKFPVSHSKLEDTVHNLLAAAEVVTPQMSVGFTTLHATGQPAIKITGNYAALVQLREQLTVAIEHHDFDFEPFQYRRPDGKSAGLVIDFLADKSMPELEPLPDNKKRKKVA